MATATLEVERGWRRLRGPKVPVAILMLLFSILLGVIHGFNAKELVATLNSGFGAALGEYALILLPSFVIAHAVSKSSVSGLPNWVAPVIAPFAGAAMVCPDTAYAALAPITEERKLSVLFGTYAGFKLLMPAGPLIVATGLGAVDNRLPIITLPVFAVAWLTGLACAYFWEGRGTPRSAQGERVFPVKSTLPLVVLAGLLVAGFLLGDDRLPRSIALLVSPKGALFAAASAALVNLSSNMRAEAMESSMKRTAPLLLTIGAASALGTMIAVTLPVGRCASMLAATGLVLPSLFAFTALFKLAKGSSMATFAGTTGIVAAVLPALHISSAAAVLAMCAGAFVTIAPNDSLYWIAKETFHERCPALGRKLAIGAFLQGTTSLAAIEAMHILGWV